ncbi:hypothetical protein Tco_1080622 [Tanacetum coccineum]|uniref:Uncharacterized protein n=1 Tax=Tanacetum coccineum TaxID=301880 RepID=A0ABQ5HX73_9ASTR
MFETQTSTNEDELSALGIGIDFSETCMTIPCWLELNLRSVRFQDCFFFRDQMKSIGYIPDHDGSNDLQGVWDLLSYEQGMDI